MLVVNYKGIAIFEEWGFYYPAIDPSIESMHLEDICLWIDNFFMQKRLVSIDKHIISGIIISMNQEGINN